MSAEESGAWLLEQMRRQIGLESYSGARLLDFGCGVRFTETIINKRIPVGSYTGVDCYAEMIDFLRSAVWDKRFSYGFLDAHHPLYNPTGRPLTPEAELPLRNGIFDVISMFSVITHQSPEDSRAIFTILRRRVDERGHLFFTYFADEGIESFEDRSPERNGGRCFYNPEFLVRLVEGCGWRLVRRAPAEAPLIGDSLVFRPVA